MVMTGVIYEKEVQLYFLVVNSITIQHLSTRNSDENRAIKVRSSITELKNVDMMAENTDINVKDEDRQSKDYPDNFSSASITDSSFKCWCHEVFIPNQRPERCSPGLDETPSDKSSERNSISSFNSIDSGYDSIKRTHLLHL